MRPHPSSSRALWPLLALISFIGLTGCGGNGVRSAHYGSETFPVPPEIEQNVDFWRQVYGVWGLDQVAFHDDKYMGVIYEVAKLPGSSGSGYSTSQKAWIRARTLYHADRVRALQLRIQNKQPLSTDDKQLLAKFERAGGTNTLYGATDRVRSQRGLRERFRRGVEISGRYDKVFREIMRNHHVPEDLAYLPHVESSFQTHARSSVGAGGVWQFMPATGRLFMTVDSRIDERFDPILAADGAARYLAQAHRKLGSWPLAITSYNHGQAGMAKAKARYGDDIGRIVKDYDGRYFGFASRNFYAEFVAAREVASNAPSYFRDGLHYEEPWTHDRLVLHYNLPVYRLASHYGVSSNQLAELNMHWRKQVIDGRADVPAGSTIWLPEGTLKRVASHPPAVPVVVARSEPKRALAAPTRSTPQAKPAAPAVIASKRAPTKQATSKARYHIVKPKETLYRVALLNGLTVSELRRLNKLSPNDNDIHPGQRLKVGI